MLSADEPFGLVNSKRHIVKLKCLEAQVFCKIYTKLLVACMSLSEVTANNAYESQPKTFFKMELPVHKPTYDNFCLYHINRMKGKGWLLNLIYKR